MFSLRTLDPLIETHSLLKHPFYVAWSKGELSKEDLALYAKEYFHLVRKIPGVVERVRERAADKKLAAQINENVVEEQEHVELWKRFAKSLGITEKALLAHKPSKKVQDAVAQLNQIAEKSFSEGVAAVYALELELPKIAQTKKEGLLKFYGLSSADAHVYFDEHLNEEKHLDVWRAMPITEVHATAAAEVSCRAQNQVLDAVCEGCGISMDC